MNISPTEIFFQHFRVDSFLMNGHRTAYRGIKQVKYQQV